MMRSTFLVLVVLIVDLAALLADAKGTFRLRKDVAEHVVDRNTGVVRSLRRGADGVTRGAARAEDLGDVKMVRELGDQLTGLCIRIDDRLEDLKEIILVAGNEALRDIDVGHDRRIAGCLSGLVSLKNGRTLRFCERCFGFVSSRS